MKLLSILMLIVSCGKIEPSAGPRLGELVEYNPQLLSEAQIVEKNRICHAISRKTEAMKHMHNQPYAFNITESNCQGESSQEERIEVVLDVSPSAIQFLRKDNNGPFVFREAETLRSGIFKNYCATDKLPFLHEGVPTWIDVRPNEYCSREAGATCVNFRLGLKETNSDSYRVSTQEIFKIDTRENSTRYGFYTERTFQSSVGCSSGSRLIKGTLN